MNCDFELQLEIKELKEDGTLTGVASVYGVEDLGGDVIERGAFNKTLAENPIIPILWQHQTDEVIGQGEVKEWQSKILLSGRLDLEDPTAQKAYRKLKNKLIKGLSVGFQTIKSTWQDVEGRMIRHIQELKLFEVSIVTFPMLPQAIVTRIKSDDLESRVQKIEERVSALPARSSTPVSVQEPEPREAKEPHVVSIEPALIHSALVRLQMSR